MSEIPSGLMDSPDHAWLAGQYERLIAGLDE